MLTISSGDLWLTKLDHARLAKLDGGRLPALLSDLLDSAEIIDSTASHPDIVMLYSQVLVLEEDTRIERQLTLGCPDEAHPQDGFISVLSPVGLAVLGRCVGTQVSWTAPAGKQRLLTIKAVLSTPA